MSEFRIEKDSMGEMKVPAVAYYGAQTQRAVENFPISDLRFPRPFIRALGIVKLCAAHVNVELGLLNPKLAKGIQTVAQEVIDGKLDDQFVVDIFQTGSGTSTNMNVNEVIAGRANELATGQRGGKSPIHPNDHVNRGQSSNDVIPTAIHISALEAIEHTTLPALRQLGEALAAKAREFDKIVKIGRTHLMDATPVRLGQQFSGYASQVEHGIRRLETVRQHLAELAIGGTAVGTGINTHLEFPQRIVRRIAELTSLPFTPAPNFFEALAARDAAVEASGALKTVAVSLTKIANDIRWLGSGPRCGIGEILLPETQPGSSIMPGKVNPVMCESVMQVAAQVIGNDATITWGGAVGGNFELNVMKPVIAFNLLQSAALIASVSRAFTTKCVTGIRANERHCSEQVELSLAMCTALAPEIGYDEAAKIAKESYETGRTVREIALTHPKLRDTPDKVARLLDPWSQTERGTSVTGGGG
ncbi:MAG: class II fumarate hydratase [Planctomycetes bacterium]|nr:class II fumarate hydratase [Planctomycetota bacterium]